MSMQSQQPEKNDRITVGFFKDRPLKAYILVAQDDIVVRKLFDYNQLMRLHGDLSKVLLEINSEIVNDQRRLESELKEKVESLGAVNG